MRKCCRRRQCPWESINSLKAVEHFTSSIRAKIASLAKIAQKYAQRKMAGHEAILLTCINNVDHAGGRRAGGRDDGRGQFSHAHSFWGRVAMSLGLGCVKSGNATVLKTQSGTQHRLFTLHWSRCAGSTVAVASRIHLASSAVAASSHVSRCTWNVTKLWRLKGSLKESRWQIKAKHLLCEEDHGVAYWRASETLL